MTSETTEGLTIRGLAVNILHMFMCALLRSDSNKLARIFTPVSGKEFKPSVKIYSVPERMMFAYVVTQNKEVVTSGRFVRYFNEEIWITDLFNSVAQITLVEGADYTKSSMDLYVGLDLMEDMITDQSIKSQISPMYKKITDFVESYLIPRGGNQFTEQFKEMNDLKKEADFSFSALMLAQKFISQFF